MKSLYFIRHGKTLANTAEKWNGQSEDPLTDEGLKQATEAGAKAKTEGLHFDLIISSPLSRAKDTATLIAKEIGYPGNLIMIDELLLERNVGVLEQTLFKVFFDEHEYADVDNVEGAETVEQLQIRATEFLDKAKGLPESDILVVSHGAFGRALVRAINNRPWTDEYTPGWDKHYIPNAEVFRLI